VDQPALRRLLQSLADTEEHEISCAECFDLLPRYVDLGVARTGGERTLPGLEQHLRQCGVCLEEYEALRDLVRSEHESPPPPEDRSPTAD
jgi:hypothetical protein